VATFSPGNEAALDRVIHAEKGRVVILNFWATWCLPRRTEIPLLQHVADKSAARGVVLILVSANEPDQEPSARRFLNRAHVTRRAYIKKAGDDQRFIDSVHPKWSGALPATFVYDRAGKRITSYLVELPLRELEVVR